MNHISKPDATLRATTRPSQQEDQCHHIGYLIHDVSRLRMRYFDTVFKSFGVTRNHWWTVGNISRLAVDGISQGKLANLLNVKKAMMGMMVDQLEDAGLVQRIAEASDRRVKRIKLTEKGAAFTDELFDKVKEMSPKFNRQISAKDLETTLRTLETMRCNVRAALDDQEAGTAVD